MPTGDTFPRLVEVMDRLLAPDGCPWDREQTLDSLRPFLVEESYEVLDALARGDVPNHREELGDVLMQVVFQAAIRQRDGQFDVDGVIDGICDKLVRRHPHVFADAHATSGAGTRPPGSVPSATREGMTSEQVLAQWEAIKVAEKAAKGERAKRTLDGVPMGPALARAQKIGTKAGRVGFDWPGWEGSFGKIEEETREVKEAIVADDARATHREIGDLLLAVVNVARKRGVDAENALIDATERFERRFEVVEDLLAARGKTPSTSNLEEMDALWGDAKKARAGHEK